MSDSQMPTIQRPRAIVTDAEALFDTAQFEHMARVASMMGSSSLMPDHLRVMRTENGALVTKDTDRSVPRYLDEKATTANAFLIVNQARLFGGIDPFALAQSSYFVHGRLGYEGKLVQAVLERRIGAMTFDYFGEAGTLQYGIKVTGWIPGSDPARQVSIEGTVEEWQTKTQSGINQQWKGKSSQHRMLHYRGTREWARLYAPGLTLGLLDDDDLDAIREDFRARGATPVGQVSGGTAAPAIEDARRFNPMEDPEDAVEEAEVVAAKPAAATVAPKAPTPQAASAGDPAPVQKPEEKPAATQERRAPRGTPARVERIIMAFQNAKTVDEVDDICVQEVRPLSQEMASLGVNFAASQDRLDAARTARFNDLEKTHREAQATAAGADRQTGEIAPEPAAEDFAELIERFRMSAEKCQTFDNLDSLVEQMFDAVALPGAEDAKVDVILEENRNRIATASAGAREDGPTEEQDQAGTQEDRFPGDPEGKLPAEGSTYAAPADSKPMTDEEIQETVDAWSAAMRKCKTPAELEDYNRDVITPFKQGPHGERISKDQLDDARTTYTNRHRLLTRKASEQA